MAASQALRTASKPGVFLQWRYGMPNSTHLAYTHDAFYHTLMVYVTLRLRNIREQTMSKIKIPVGSPAIRSHVSNKGKSSTTIAPLSLVIIHHFSSISL